MTMNGPAEPFAEIPAGALGIVAPGRTAMWRALVACTFATCAIASALADSKPEGQIGATGYIAPATGIILMRAPPDAIIRTIYVHLGDHMKKGDPLVELVDDAPKAELGIAAAEYDTATRNATLRTAAAALSLSLAEEKLQRAQKEAAAYRAVGAGGTSSKELIELAGSVEEARLSVELEKAKQQQVQTETDTAAKTAAARLDLAKTKLATYFLHAPSDGTILKLDRSVGDATTGEPLLQFADLSAMTVICQVYEGDMLKLKRGMKATVQATGIPDLGPGVVEQIGQLIDTRSQLGEVRIRLDRVTPADRLVGMSVEVVIGP
jgi:HlyD family secretion protein